MTKDFLLLLVLVKNQAKLLPPIKRPISEIDIWLVSKLLDNFPLNITDMRWDISINSSKSWEITITEVPLLANSIKDFLIECSAPALD